MKDIDLGRYVAAGAAFGAAAACPPLAIAVGGLWLLGKRKQQQDAEAIKEQVTGEPFSDEETDELVMLSRMLENAPDDRAREAIIEEFS